MSYKIKHIESKDSNDFILKYGHETYPSYIFLNGLKVNFAFVSYNLSHWTKNNHYTFEDINGVKVAEIPVEQVPENMQEKLDQIANESQEVKNE